MSLRIIPFRERRFLHVEWIDASGPNSGGWRHMDLLNLDEQYLCWSSGWVIAESHDRLYLAPHLGNIDSQNLELDEQVFGYVSIPKKMIRRQKRLDGLRRE